MLRRPDEGRESALDTSVVKTFRINEGSAGGFSAVTMQYRCKKPPADSQFTARISLSHPQQSRSSLAAVRRQRYNRYPGTS